MTSSLPTLPRPILYRMLVICMLACFPWHRPLAQIPAPRPNTYVDDFAGVLSEGDIAAINAAIYAIEKKDSVQIAVVLVSHLPEDMEIEDFAREIGRQWHAGIDRKGLVYVASIGQNKQRLEVSANLEGVIPDITAHAITEQLKPFLRKKEYGDAMKTMVGGIAGALEADKGQGSPAGTGVVAAGGAKDSFINKAADPASIKARRFSGGQVVLILFIIASVPLVMLVVWIFSLMRRRFTGGAGTYFFSSRSDIFISSDQSSGSGDSGSSGSSDYGNWGGSDSSSSSSDSGFDGGGSSNDW